MPHTPITGQSLALQETIEPVDAANTCSDPDGLCLAQLLQFVDDELHNLSSKTGIKLKP
jgi:hypothetical protein